MWTPGCGLPGDTQKAPRRHPASRSPPEDTQEIPWRHPGGPADTQEPPAKRHAGASSRTAHSSAGHGPVRDCFAAFGGYSPEDFDNMSQAIRPNMTILHNANTEKVKWAAVETLQGILTNNPDDFSASNINAQSFAIHRAALLSAVEAHELGAGGA